MSEIDDLREEVRQLRAEVRALQNDGSSAFRPGNQISARNPLNTVPAIFGRRYSDVQGNFYPFTIRPDGTFLINTSANHPNSFLFHETKNLNPIDVYFGMRASAVLGIYPATTDTPVFLALQNAPTDALATRGMFFFSGFSAGNPDIRVIESTGSRDIYKQTFIMRIKAGVPADGDYDTPNNGMVTIDTTNVRIYARTGGGWKYAPLINGPSNVTGSRGGNAALAALLTALAGLGFITDSTTV